MQSNNVDPTPWSTQCSQSILKIPMAIHGALSKGDRVMPFALSIPSKSHVVRRLFRQGASKPTSRRSPGVQSHRQQIPAKSCGLSLLIRPLRPPPHLPVYTRPLEEGGVHIRSDICVLELYLAACSGREVKTFFVEFPITPDLEQCSSEWEFGFLGSEFGTS